MHSALDKLFFNRATLPLRPFYRRYPFRSPASMRSANDRGMVDLELGFFCNRVPKAANSTVVTNLTRLKLGHDVPSEEAKKISVRPGHLSGADMARFDEIFKFTVVRNPYSRVLSAYLNKVVRFPERCGEISFAEFLQRLAAEPEFLYSNAHWVPQADLMLIPAKEFDFIGKVESLDRDLAEIKRRIRPDIKDEITTAGPPATGASKKLREYYSDDSLIALVADIYRQDFTTFGYSTELPA